MEQKECGLFAIDFKEFIRVEHIQSGIDYLATRMPEIKRAAMSFVPAFEEDGQLPEYQPITIVRVSVCGKLRKLKGTNFCACSDKKWMLRARDRNRALTYSCPGGLTEFVIPLFWKDRWLGTVIGGQIIPGHHEESRQTFKSAIREINLNISQVQEEMLSMRMRQVELIAGFLELWLDSLIADNALEWFMRNVEKRVPKGDPEKALSTMVDLIERLIGVPACSIFVYDDESKRLVLRATTSREEGMKAAVGKPDEGYDPDDINKGGLTGWVYKFQYPLLVHCVTDEKELGAIGRSLEKMGFSEMPKWVGWLRETTPGQFLGVPMEHGVIRISVPPNGEVQLRSRDKEVLSAAVHYVYAVIEDVTARGRTAVLEMGQVLSKSRSLRQLLTSAAEIATQRFSCATTQICLIDREKNDLVVEVVHGIDKARGKRYELEGEGKGIAVHVANTGEVLRAENAKVELASFFSGIHDDDLKPPLEQAGLSPGGSVLCAPIDGATECLGTIKLIGKKERRGFSFEDEIALRALARIIGAAMEDVRAQDITRIGEMMLKLASLPSLHDTAQIIIETAMEMMPNSTLGHLLLAEGVDTKVRIEAYKPPDIEQELDRLHRAFQNQRGLVYHVIAKKEAFYGNVSEAIEQDIDYIECRRGIQSEITVPLMIGDRAIGAINVESETLNSFGEEDLNRLQLLAGYAAVVIHSTRILENLLESVRAVNSENAVEDILTSVSDGAARLLDVDIVSIMLLDETGTYLRILHSRGPKEEDQEITRKRRFHVGRSLPGMVIHRRDTFQEWDAQESIDTEHRDLAIRLGLGSYIGVPMFGRSGDIFGVLSANTSPENLRQFTQCEQSFLSILARYAAIAIETGQHMAELERLRRMNIDMARTGKLSEMVEVVYKHLKELGIQSCTIRMLDPEEECLEAIGGFGPYAERAKRKLSLSEDSKAVSVQAYSEKKYIVKPRADAEFFNDFIQQLKPGDRKALDNVKVLASFPIIFNNEVTGILGVQADRGDFFDPLTLRQIQDFLQGIPVAFKNVMLAEFTRGLASSAVHSLSRLRESLGAMI